MIQHSFTCCHSDRRWISQFLFYIRIESKSQNKESKQNVQNCNNVNFRYYFRDHSGHHNSPCSHYCHHWICLLQKVTFQLSLVPYCLYCCFIFVQCNNLFILWWSIHVTKRFLWLWQTGLLTPWIHQRTIILPTTTFNSQPTLSYHRRGVPPCSETPPIRQLSWDPSCPVCLIMAQCGTHQLLCHHRGEKPEPWTLVLALRLCHSEVGTCCLTMEMRQSLSGDMLHSLWISGYFSVNVYILINFVHVCLVLLRLENYIFECHYIDGWQ